MLKPYIKFLLLGSLLVSLFSCRDDILFSQDRGESNPDGSLPIEIEASIMDNFSTRSIANPKQNFISGDVIHILGTFPMQEGDTITKYGAFQFSEEENKWNPILDKDDIDNKSPFTWPNNATGGQFTAYYLPNSTDLLTENSSTKDVSLSDLTGGKEFSDRDPLKAVSVMFAYGHAIKLNFFHACAYLNIIELPGGISEKFWLTQENSQGEVPATFNNGFNLQYTVDAATGEKNLKLNFVQMPDPQYNNAVYVEGITQDLMVGDEMKASVGFFLEPGSYTNFVLGYPGYDSMTKYLSYTKDPKADDPTNPNNILEENGIYEFNIAQSMGVIRVTNPDNNSWDEDLPPYPIVDAEQFLWAVANGLEYNHPEDGLPILIKTDEGTKLVRNIDMNFQVYDVFPPDDEKGDAALHPGQWFEPNIDEGKEFDGGMHFIHNLGSPLVRYNDGTIKNLGIATAKINFVSDENPAKFNDADKMYDMSRVGTLCCFNRSGIIENVQFKGGSIINVRIQASSSQETHNSGVIVGSNTGTINNIYLTEGSYTVQIGNNAGNSVIPSVNMGGILGQQAGGTIANINPMSGTPSIGLMNFCVGERAQYNIGGIVGAQTGGTITDVILPSIIIYSGRSTGLISKIGGMAGRLENTPGLILRDCTVSGSVMAGKTTYNAGDIHPEAYTGGIAGEYWEAGSVTVCRSVMSVSGPRGGNIYDSAESSYGTGGVFGIVSSAADQTYFGGIRDIIVSLTSFAGESNPAKNVYMGNFTGILPNSQSWDDYADCEIVVTGNTISNMVGNQ